MLQKRAVLEIRALVACAVCFVWMLCFASPVLAVETMQSVRERPFKGTVIASDPSVVHYDGRYWMAYTELDWRSSHTVIAMAMSLDGLNWTPVTTDDAIPGVVMRGGVNLPYQNLEAPELVRTKTGWLLYFSAYQDKGYPAKGFPASLWLATSYDGVHFSIFGTTAVMVPTPGWYDNDAIYSPSIVRRGGKYIMAYAGHAYTDTSKIAHGGVYVLGAESYDGIVWTKLDNPLLGPGDGPAWMRDGAGEPELFVDKMRVLHLLFTGLSGEDRIIGIAEAPNWPGPFKVRPTAVLVPDPAEGEVKVLAPSVVVEQNRMRMWYLSYIKANNSFTWQVGQAELNPAEVENVP